MSHGDIKLGVDLDTKELEGSLGKIKSRISQGMVAATAAAAAGVGAAVKVGMDFEAQMSKVGAISMASAEDMEILNDKAKEMGETTVFSASQAGQAFEYMAMAGWKTEDMVSGISGVMDLAAASGEDLGTVSDIVTDALTAFGLTAQDSGRFADVLAAASSNANTNVSMMGETFKYVAPVAGAMGYSIEDTATVIGLMANSGIKASQAGTSLRQILLGLQGGAKLTGKAFGTMNVNVENSDGSMRDLNDVVVDLRSAFSKMTAAEKAANAESIAGKIGMSGLLAIVNASENDFNKLTSAIENSSGTAKEMAERNLDNLKGQLTLAGSAAEGLGIAVYEGIEEPLKNAVKTGASKISELTKSFKDGKLTGALQNTGELLGDIVDGGIELATVAIPPVISGISFLGSNIKTLTPIIAANVLAVKGWSVLGNITNSFKAASAAIQAKTAATTLGQAADVRGITVSALKLKYDSAYVASLSAQQIGVSALTGKTTLLTAAKAMATKAQLGLNAAWAANPIGVVVAGAAALAAVLGIVYIATNKQTEADKMRQKRIEENKKAIEELANAEKERAEAQAERVSEDIAVIDNTKRLSDELFTLVGANGEVDEANRARVDFILGELNNALGTEYKMIDGQIQKYGDLKKSIYDAIETKRLEILMQAQEENYANALKNRLAAENAKNEAFQNMVPALEAYTQAQNNADNAVKKYYDALKNGTPEEIRRAELSVAETRMAVENKKSAYDELRAEYDKSEATLKNYYRNIDEYETASIIAKEQGSAAAIKYIEETDRAYLNADGAQQYASKQEEVLAQLGNNYIGAVENLKSALSQYANTGSESARKMVEDAIAKVQEAGTEYEAAGGDLGIGFVTALDGTPVSLATLTGGVNTEIQSMVDSANGYGVNFAWGVRDGIKAGTEEAVGQAKSLADQIKAVLPWYWDEHSPSKVAEEFGRMYSLGAAVGIEDEIDTAVEAATKLGEGVIDATTAYNAEYARITAERNAADAESERQAYEEKLSKAKKSAEKKKIIAEQEAKDKKKADDEYLNGLKEAQNKEFNALDTALDLGLITTVKYYDALTALRDKYFEEGTEDWGKYTEKIIKGQREEAFRSLKFNLDMQYITEEQYYKGIEALRDQYFAKGTEEWNDYTLEIKNFYVQQAEDAKEKIKQLSDEIMGPVKDSITSMEDKLKSSMKVTADMKFGDETIKILSDPEAQKKSIQQYIDNMTSLKERMRSLNLGEDFEKYFLSYMSDLSQEEGNVTARLLMQLEDKDFQKQMFYYQENFRLSEQGARLFYFDDWKEGMQEIKERREEEGLDEKVDEATQKIKELSDEWDREANEMTKRLEEMGLEVPKGFFDSGKESAIQFGKGFKDMLKETFDELRSAVASYCVQFSPLFNISYQNNGIAPGNTYTSSYNFYGSGQTVSEQLREADNHATLERLRKG